MTQLQVITDSIFAIQDQFEKIADTHKMVVWREESEFALQAFNKNAFLAKCDPLTVQAAIKNVASVGLTLNPAHQLAYLVPEYNKGTNGQDCQLRISFQGLIRLATNSGAIKLVKAEVVRVNDKFDYKGPLEMPSHSIAHPFNDADRGNPIGVYCVAITNEERVICDLMSWDEVLKIKSAAKTQMVWDKWPLEMAKKAIIKRAYKQWPKTEKSAQLIEAVSLMNKHEGSEDLEAKFKDLLVNGSAIEFYGFKESITEEEYTNLYNSGETGKKIILKEKCNIKEKDAVKEINSLIYDMESEDEEIKEAAIAVMKSKNDIEKDVVRQFMQGRR